MCKCVIALITDNFCVYCESIDSFCETTIRKNGCNFAASNETNKNRILNNKTDTYARNNR